MRLKLWQKTIYAYKADDAEHECLGVGFVARPRPVAAGDSAGPSAVGGVKPARRSHRSSGGRVEEGRDGLGREAVWVALASEFDQSPAGVLG